MAFSWACEHSGQTDKHGVIVALSIGPLHLPIGACYAKLT